MLDARGRVVEDRALVRDAVSIVTMCELAEEAAGGGDLDELRSRLVALRLTENPPGIDEAEEAAIELAGDDRRAAAGRVAAALSTPSARRRAGSRRRSARGRARRSSRR